MPLQIGNGFPPDSLSASPTGTIFEEVEPPLTPKVGSADSFMRNSEDREEEKNLRGQGRAGGEERAGSSFYTP